MIKKISAKEIDAVAEKLALTVLLPHALKKGWFKGSASWKTIGEDQKSVIRDIARWHLEALKNG